MADPKLDERLLAFLIAHETANRAGYTPEAMHQSLRTIADRQVAHENKDEERFMELLGAQRGHSLRIGVLERDVNKIGDEVEDTGKFHIESLEKQLEEKKALLAKVHDETTGNQTFWRRQWAMWLVALVMLLLGGAVSACVAVAVAKFK